ncbi:MAG: hypothetical protein GX564_02730 [Oligosphaeraceae bacterium]|nr:hypothetical protein [Oligosphaeraceae bacterium]
MLPHCFSPMPLKIQPAQYLLPAIIFLCLYLGAQLLAQSVNLVQNHDFSGGTDSNGVPVGWRLSMSKATQGGAVVLPDQPQPGRFTLHLFKNSPEGSVNLTQTVRLKPNTEYEYYVRGRRQAAYRWHYFGVRCPDTSISLSGHLPHDDSAVAPLFFRSDTGKTLCYLTLALWGREENKDDTVGEMWIEEVVLREVTTPPARISGLGNYFFPSDELSATLWLQNYSGSAKIILQTANRQFAQLDCQVTPGNNPFILSLREVPAGPAELIVTAGEISLSQPIIIQEGVLP